MSDETQASDNQGLPIQTVHGISYPRVGLKGAPQEEPHSIIADLASRDSEPEQPTPLSKRSVNDQNGCP